MLPGQPNNPTNVTPEGWRPRAIPSVDVVDYNKPSMRTKEQLQTTASTAVQVMYDNIFESAPRCIEFATSGCRLYNDDTVGDFLLASNNPGAERCQRAAEILVELFTCYKVDFAFYGGYALYLMGSDREPRDVDVIMASENVDEAIDLLRTSRRACVGQYQRGSDITTVFLNTDLASTPSPMVKVDIIREGCHFTPKNLLDVTRYPRHAQGWRPSSLSPPLLAPFSIIYSKIHAHAMRRLVSDTDFLDLLWLFDKYEDLMRPHIFTFHPDATRLFYESARGYSWGLGMRVRETMDPQVAETPEQLEEMYDDTILFNQMSQGFTRHQ